MFPQEGDFVTIKSKEEIRNTLDDEGRLHNVWFAYDMYNYCGETLRVRDVLLGDNGHCPDTVNCAGWSWCREWFWTQDELEANDESSFDDNLISAIL